MPPTSRLLLTYSLNLIHRIRLSQFNVRGFGAQETSRHCNPYLQYTSVSRYFSSFPDSIHLLSKQSRASSRVVRVPPALKRPSTRPSRGSRYFVTETSVKHPAHPAQLQYKASLGSPSVVSIVVIGVALLLYGTVGYQKRNLVPTNGSNFQDEEQENKPVRIQHWSKMAGGTLPGRPGTLTPEQEEKLREFWAATLLVFGVLTTADLGSAGGLDVNAIGHHETNEKVKKSRLAFFGKKKNKDSDSESLASGEPSPSVPNHDEDKYGQTKQYHEALAQQTPAQLRSTLWSMVKHDNPDALLLRFLRARKWDVEKALIMMVSTMHWRAEELHVDDDIMKTGEEGSLTASKSALGPAKQLGEDFLAQMRLGKSFLHGTDKEGRPMCFVRVRLHKQGEQSEESLERYTVFIIETARMVLSPPIDTACVVFDMTGFSMANMDYSPVKFMIKCFEANYPESLGVVLVHKAPWVFQGIWKIIKGWLDPVVASKVKFTNNVAEMEEYVPKTHIPKDLGGDEDWTYQYVEPVPDENSKMAEIEAKNKLESEREAIVKTYENATVEWIKNSKSPGVTDILTTRTKLAMDLKENYWRLDPYVRARSYYDRVGLLQPSGKLQFYPEKAPTNGIHNETSADDVD